MLAAQDLLATLHRSGFKVTPLPGDRLEVRPASKLTDELRGELRQHKAEVLVLLQQQRRFLSRPLGQEENLDPWQAWEPFMGWLLEHNPQHYYAVCEAEDAISTLERQGIVEGAEYAAACDTLRQRFETARKLALKARVKVWVQ